LRALEVVAAQWFHSGGAADGSLMRAAAVAVAATVDHASTVTSSRTKVRRGRRGRLLAVATTVGLGLQVPAVAAAGYVSRHYGLAAAGAALLSLPALTAIRRGHGQWHRSRWELYLVLWPFFAWWAICLAFLLFGPLAIALAAF
jgi:hypothetical protein